MLVALDILYTILHVVIVGFNLTGWIFPKTRKAHLIVLSLTIVAWLGIGMAVGVIGYCPLTDWHWDVKRELGERGLPSSFIKYLVDAVFRIDSNATFIDIITAAGLIFAVIMAVIKNRLIQGLWQKLRPSR